MSNLRKGASHHLSSTITFNGTCSVVLSLGQNHYDFLFQLTCPTFVSNLIDIITKF